MGSTRAQKGATLIELVVSMVIISVVVTGVMMVVSNTTRNSADPMIRSQALSIADAYLQEIVSQAMTDPAGSDVFGPEAGESRATFDDVTDYNGLADNAGAVDQNGNPIAGLEGYNVDVAISATTLNGDPANRILVTVTYDGDPDFSLSLSSYRLN
jgi:MSHA pilin protein MshD